MNAAQRLASYLAEYKEDIGKVVDFDPIKDRFYHFDFTVANKELNKTTISDIDKFSNWINDKLSDNNCRFGIGGYMEERIIYQQPLFNQEKAIARSIHLGVDVWAGANTAVYSPLNGQIYSLKDNNNAGDYGPTIIVEHNLDGLCLYSLYGHISRKSLVGIHPGDFIQKGERIGWLGSPAENGNWPPHLHFQLMFDMEGRMGDYPGVCSKEDVGHYRLNVPNPQLILRIPQFEVHTSNN